MMAFITCSIIRMVIPPSRSVPMKFAISPASLGFSPATTSSSSRISGAVESARATSRRFRSTRLRLLHRFSAFFSRPTLLQRGRSPALRFLHDVPLLVAEEGPDQGVFQNGHLQERFGDLKSAGDPQLADFVRLQEARYPGPGTKTLPWLGLYTPAMMLKSVVFPAPLGPIRPEDFAGMKLERDLADRGQAAKIFRKLPPLEKRTIFR